jgi:hypothetical protein
MAASTTLLQFLLMVVAGWLQRQQAATIDYLKAENRMLRGRLGGRRIVFTDAERRQLAEKARALGRKSLHELGTMLRLRHCFAGTASWWRGSGLSLRNAVLVGHGSVENWLYWWCVWPRRIGVGATRGSMGPWRISVTSWAGGPLAGF